MRSGTQSIERAAQVLKALAAVGPDGVRVSQLAGRTRLGYPTLYRILQCLVAEGLAHRDGSRRYTLGQLVYELSLRAPAHMDVRGSCAATMTHIARETGDTVFLNVRSGLDSVCIDRREGTFPIKTLILEIGQRRPLGVGAAGLALLMALPHAEAEHVVTANERQLGAIGGMSVRKVREMIERGRELGYLFLEDGAVRGVGVLSIPFRPRGAASPAAISVAAITSRMFNARKKEIIGLVRREIGQLE
jgi:DNA-binding IclR family transcriptional regulator